MADTFKTRVENFWNWFPQVAQRFYDTIEDGRCGDLTGEVSEFMENTLPRMAWVFGPGEGGGHSFTVSGEGVVSMQLLADYWQKQAPSIDGWTFYGWRQPADPNRLKDMAIGIGPDAQVDVESFLIQTSVDDERKLIDIIAWHPTYESLPEEHHMQILFLLLDEALGEFGVEQWLGSIDVEPIGPGDDVRSLAELPQFVEHVNNYYDWEKLPPLESRTLYQLSDDSEPSDDGTRRGDTLVGQTTISNVVFEFMENEGRLPEDPLEETGAEFIYIAIDSDVFPEGSQADVRGNIEDTLDEALEAERSGQVLGGAFGINQSYIELILFDGANSRAIVERTLDGLQLKGRSRIETFV